MILSILIPTIIERAELFHKLNQTIKRQIIDYDLHDQVEIIHKQDNKEWSIGEKRNWLYNKANGLYSWQIDDDDMIHHQALPMIINAINKSKPSCICFKELCIFDGKRVESSNFSMQYTDWADNHDGFNHVRTPFFKTPILTEICRKVPVPPIRFGEDHEFSKKILPLLLTEEYIDEFIYIYRHNPSSHNERYGIKP